MKDDFNKKIEEIISETKCPKNFKCVQNGFDNLCKAQDIGIENFLECLEDNPLSCPFVVMFADSYFCKCPVRVYVAKNLKK